MLRIVRPGDVILLLIIYRLNALPEFMAVWQALKSFPWILSAFGLPLVLLFRHGVRQVVELAPLGLFGKHCIWSINTYDRQRVSYAY